MMKMMTDEMFEPGKEAEAVREMVTSRYAHNEPDKAEKLPEDIERRNEFVNQITNEGGFNGN